MYKCEHDARTEFFTTKNHTLICKHCGVKIKLSDAEFSDWVWCRNAYRDPENQLKYNYIEVNETNHENSQT